MHSFKIFNDKHNHRVYYRIVFEIGVVYEDGKFK